ncbi:unnamed protein product [Brachionus calyciflorus]|uniref:AMP deaminase n=1 Tax=Brachionus calyciflorus TaxID=104777 RepID=A0A813NNM0_9BILA|nr:unnamed protein product [Brachionus calyciflorus]
MSQPRNSNGVAFDDEKKEVLTNGKLKEEHLNDSDYCNNNNIVAKSNSNENACKNKVRFSCDFDSDESELSNKSSSENMQNISSNSEELDEVKNLEIHDQHNNGHNGTNGKHNGSNGGLKQTYSEAMMNSQLLNSLPKYIFQSNHARLTSVTPFINEIKEQQNLELNDKAIDGEVSEYPIELIESQQHAIERHMSIKTTEPIEQDTEHIKGEIKQPEVAGLEHEINYNRIIINEDAEGAEIEDLEFCSQLLVKAMIIREKYMMLSQQSYPFTTAKYLNKVFLDDQNVDRRNSIFSAEQAEQEFLEKNDDHPIHPPETEGDPFDIEFQPSLKCRLKMIGGIIQIFNEDGLPYSDFVYPDIKMFIDDYHLMVSFISNGPLKTFCYRRLQYLKSKFELHSMLNEFKEISQQKSVPHRDFYNVRKVDTHIHAASCMNQKHLLRFIKKKIKTNGDTVVLNHQTKGPMSLNQVFKELNLTTFDLSVDKLAMHADRNTFHRFDKFNAKYNPIGQSSLRDIFIKVDNDINGVFFAEILKEVTSDLEESKYQNAELRLSIYGRKFNEWDRLAEWAVKNKMYSPNNRWIIQIPRIYDIFKANKLVDNFSQILYNIFMPLFEVTNDPNSHPYLHQFLYHVSGFDSVDDESKPERDRFNQKTPKPEDWNSEENPPYVYYLYYMYANIQVLNNFRRVRNMNIFNFRPHCGEAGGSNHLISSFLLAENISHGLVLRKVPVLQYLYYLCQVGIAMSPLSNNSMFLNYIKNPFYEYHQIGLNISLSTDDPLQFHFTKEPLMEEYSIATQVWKLSPVDMCELARNSVVMSGFPTWVKKHWLGPNFKKEGVKGNDVKRTNIPDIRVAFRYDTWIYELNLLVEGVNKKSKLSSHH